MEFVQAAAPLGLRAIHGAEVDLEDGRHLTLLVESERGWRNLCHLLTRAHAHTRGAVDEKVEDRAARRSGLGRRESLVGTRMSTRASAASRRRASRWRRWSSTPPASCA